MSVVLLATSLPMIVEIPAGTPKIPEIRTKILQSCHENKSTGNEVLVCGNRAGENSNRVAPIPTEAEPLLPPARLSLGDGVHLSGENEGASVGGFQSNRVMARVKFEF